MDLATLRLLEARLRDCRNSLERQLAASEDRPPLDPLERLWARAARAQLREIDEALKRLPSDTFGVCERCREPISPGQLYTTPWARDCFACRTASPSARAVLVRSGLVPSYWF